MKLKFFLHIALLFTLFHTILLGQDMIVLEKTRSGRNMKIREYESIKVMLKGSEMKIKGQITRISDSSMVINYDTEVMIRDISRVYTERWGYSFLQKVLLVSGLAYLTIGSLNGAINNDGYSTPQDVYVISGSLIAGGLLLIPLTTRIHDIEKGKWKIKILDFVQ